MLNIDGKMFSLPSSSESAKRDVARFCFTREIGVIAWAVLKSPSSESEPRPPPLELRSDELILALEMSPPGFLGNDDSLTGSLLAGASNRLIAGKGLNSSSSELSDSPNSLLDTAEVFVSSDWLLDVVGLSFSFVSVTSRDETRSSSLSSLLVSLVTLSEET